MRLLQLTTLLVLAALPFTSYADDVKPVPVTAPPLLTGPAEGKWLAEVKVKNVPEGTAIIWDVFPVDPLVPRTKVQKRTIKVEQACVVAGPPGKYEVLVRLVKGDNIEELTGEVTLTGDGSTPPTPPVPPTPPDPARKDMSYQIVYVEDTDANANSRKGSLFTNKALDARMKEKGHSWRIVTKDNPAADVADEIKDTTGKGYPQVFFNDKGGKLKRLQFNAPLKAEDLIKLLESNGG